MTLGRSAKSGSGGSTATVMPHAELMSRLRKSLYFGGEVSEEEMEISRPLAEYASELFSAPHKGHSLNRLNMIDAGSVHASPCSLIMALIYLDRLNMTDPSYVRRITPQELFIVSMMISTKFYAGYDEGFYLLDWAADGDMTEDRLKQLELEFLCAIDWNVYISNEEFFGKLNTIEKTLARREGLRRGWLTYSELMQMLPSFALAKFIFNNITVMAVSYAASVMTIAGAFFLASQIPGNALHRKVVPTTNVNTQLQGPANYTAQTMRPHEGQSMERTNQTNAVHSIPSNHNTTCIALNVEAELLKLERQYREEALREDLRRRNHEIVSDNRLNLPEAAQQWQDNGEMQMEKRNAQRNWFVLKEEYTEQFKTTAQRQRQRLEPKSSSLPCFADCVWNLSNCTTTIFWQLLFGDTAQQSFVRLPLMWFKFM